VWYRSIALLACVVFAFTGLGAALHASHVEHRRCAAHGEWVHVSSDVHAPDEGAPGDDDEHEHCSLVAAQTTPPVELVDARVGLANPPLVTISVERSPVASRGRARAQLVVAPKTSPPLAR
jgi:hypothetical protein